MLQQSAKKSGVRRKMKNRVCCHHMVKMTMIMWNPILKDSSQSSSWNVDTWAYTHVTLHIGHNIPTIWCKIRNKMQLNLKIPTWNDESAEKISAHFFYKNILCSSVHLCRYASQSVNCRWSSQHSIASHYLMLFPFFQLSTFLALHIASFFLRVCKQVVEWLCRALLQIIFMQRGCWLVDLQSSI